ncbi:MAG: LacI family DNA-binding transcriptional regulator [Firmicutes bacterium]|nr:LacI family DNA-binding transcriptional regulator [Bacillota bacterium]
MVTIRDVALKAGVSKTTVSHALSGRRPVAEETRARIARAIDELGYQPNSTAQSLATRRTGILGMVYPLPELGGSDLAAVEFIFSAADRMASAGYKFLLLTTAYEDTQELLKVVRGGHVDGLILMEIRLADERVRMLREEGFPFVMIGRCRSNAGLDYVDIDASSAIYEGTKHLIGLGHKRIAFIGISPWDFGYTQRGLLGYKKALRDAGLSYDNILVRACPYREGQGRKLIKELLGASRPFSAVITCGDLTAAEITGALREEGVKVPDDMSVISFGNSPLCTFTIPPLTALTTRAREMSEIAVDMLIRKLRGESLKRHQVLLRPELVIRGTTGPAPHDVAYQAVQ